MMDVNWLDERKEIVAWIAAGVCFLPLCLLATFPYTALHQRLLAELNRATDMEVRVADWSVGLPLGLEWRNVTFSKSDWGPIHLAFLQAKVEPMKALGGKLGLDIAGQIDEETPTTGVAKGTVTAPLFALTGPVTVKGQLQQIDLSKVLRRYVSRGVLNGDFSHHIDLSQATAGMVKGDGIWKAEVRDLAIEQIPVGNGQTLSLAFSRITAGLMCQDIVCDVTELKGDGIDGSFTGEGKITIQRPMRNSQLALTVTLVPGAGFVSKAAMLGIPALPPGTPMTVKILGTLAEARIAL
jgi:type II secretion system protein N